MYSCSLFFFLLLLIFTLVSASISHFLTAAIKFSCFSSHETRLLVFCLDLSLLSTSVQTSKFSRKINSALLLFFLSKSPGGHVIYRQNAQVLEKRNCTPAHTKGWTYERKYVRTILSEPKFLGCIDNQNFLPLVLRCARYLCYYYFQSYNN